MFGADAKEALRLLVQTCSRAHTVYDGSPEPAIPPRALTSPARDAGVICTLAHKSQGEELGFADTRMDPVLDDDDEQTGFEVRQDGYQVYTCTAKFRAFKGTEAYEYAQRLGRRLRLPSSRAALRAEGMALIDVLNILEMNLSVDNRAVSYAVCEFRIRVTETEIDEEIPFIESVGEFKGEVD